MSASFPSELSALSARSLSARSPLPGYADFIKLEDGIKTPITPPIAYTDFLKSMSPTAGDHAGSGKSTPTSHPSSASSTSSGCSCNCDTHKSPTSTIPPSPFAYPQSAPAMPRKIRIPASPAYSAGGIDSPRSATSMRSPFSMRSPLEWEIESKSRYFDSPKSATRPVSLRQVVTRTVTYTPRMNLEPAPKGKRRRLD